MKAILIKSLPCTNNLPMRIKVIIEGQKPFIISVDSDRFIDNIVDCKALQAAKLALIHWSMTNILNLNYLSIGQLCNGDYAITLVNKACVLKDLN